MSNNILFKKIINILIMIIFCISDVIYAGNAVYPVRGIEYDANGIEIIETGIDFNDHSIGDVITIVNGKFFTSMRYLGIDPLGNNDSAYEVGTAGIYDGGGKHLVKTYRVGELDADGNVADGGISASEDFNLQEIQQNRTYGVDYKNAERPNSTEADNKSGVFTNNFKIAASGAFFNVSMSRTTTLLYDKLLNDKKARATLKGLEDAQKAADKSDKEFEEKFEEVVIELKKDAGYSFNLFNQLSKDVNPFDYSQVNDDYNFKSTNENIVSELSHIRSTILATKTKTAEKEKLKEIGIKFVEYADEAYADGEVVDGNVLKEYAYEISDVIVGLDPITGTGRDLYEAFTGKNLITGETLTDFERSFAVFGGITFGFGSKIGKGVKLINKLAVKHGFNGLKGALKNIPNIMGKYQKHANYRWKQLWKTESKIVRENQLLYELSKDKKQFVQDLDNVKTWLSSSNKTKLKDINEDWLKSIELDIKSGNIVPKHKGLSNGLSTMSPKNHKILEQNFILGEAAGKARIINLKPKVLNSDIEDWGLRAKHVDKHFFKKVTDKGEFNEFSMVNIDPGGTGDKWSENLTELFNSPVKNKLDNGMLDIQKTFVRSDGKGVYKMGIRLNKLKDGSFDLVTVLTGQNKNYFKKFPIENHK